MLNTKRLLTLLAMGLPKVAQNENAIIAFSNLDGNIGPSTVQHLADELRAITTPDNTHLINAIKLCVGYLKESKPTGFSLAQRARLIGD